jgi:hypothetical protein
MRSYVAVTGVLFFLLTLAHVWRAIVERNLSREPFFVVVTIVATVLWIWALRLLRKSAIYKV